MGESDCNHWCQASCDGLSHVSKYGITAVPSLMDGATQMGTVSLNADSLSQIIIGGGSALGGCTFSFTPSVTPGAGSISWAVKGASTCTKFVKGSIS
jgi:predicted alternative tryptophan synthase beta-subunit